MKRPELKGLKKDQLDYVLYLEEEIQSFKNDGAKRLLFELSGIAGDFANDIASIRSGAIAGKYINDDKSDAMIDKVMKLVDKMDKFKMLTQLTEDKDEEEDKPKKKTTRRPEDLAFNGTR
jgi:hypothetical protein